jgi:hypothetical protein
MNNNFFESFLDKFVNAFFSKDRTFFYLLVILLFAFLLRIIAAINLGVSADDMHHSVHAINFLGSNKLSLWDQSASLWHCLTDVFYHIFGATQFSSRFSAILFGSLSIILIFLLTKEFFGSKAGLIAAVLLAISSFHIKNTLSEMDNTVVFFISLSLFLFINAVHFKKEYFNFLLSGISLGLGVLTKVYALLFIPVLIAYALYFNYKENKHFFDKKTFKILFVFLASIFIFCIPALTHNYLLYKDRGFMDFIFTNTLGFGKETATQYYSWAAGWDMGSDWKGVFFGNSFYEIGSKAPLSLYYLGFLFYPDPLIFILGVVGLIFCFTKKRSYLFFFIFTFLFVYLYMASKVTLSKHYIFLLFIFIPPAASFISKIDDFIKSKMKSFKLRYLLIVLVILGLFMLGVNTKYTITHFYSKSGVASLMDYKEENIHETDLVIADSRIYRGRIHWTLNGRNYIESAYLQQLLNLSESLPGTKYPTDVYFIECVSDDCGWGTIKNQPDFNKSMENIVSFFENNSKLKKEIIVANPQKIYFPLISKKDVIEYKIYKTTFMLNPSIFQAIKSTKTWFLYPIGYDESIQPIFDKYKTYNPLDTLLDKLAHLILYISIILVFLSVLYVFYLLINEK